MEKVNKSLTKIFVNGKEIFVPKGFTVLQACEQTNHWVPRFCFHEKLSISGNCRMCLVEQEKAPKPLIAACALNVTEGLRILTDSPLVRKARESVLEFLFINHPLDCPICDQGGECDLQDQAIAFGRDRGRYNEEKRAVMSGFGFETLPKGHEIQKDNGALVSQDFGPFINTIMTRCIHCTRCVRFAREIAGTPDSIGITGRGRNSEVGIYTLQKAGDGNSHKTLLDGGPLAALMSSGLSGNLIDICPVGALTSKPYAFLGRSWELKGTESIDVMDGLGRNIRIETRGAEVLRILPRSNEYINEEWLSDTSRFSLDGLKRQRLGGSIGPLYRATRDADFQEISWLDALQKIFKHWKENHTYPVALLGDLVDTETVSLIKNLWRKKGAKALLINGVNLSPLNTDFRTNYKFNTSLDLNEFDCCILINLNPKIDGAVWNAKLRQRILGAQASLGILPNFKVATLGSALYARTSNLPGIQHLGSSMKSLVDLIEGKHPWLKVLLKRQNPLIILGSDTLLQRQEAFELKIFLDFLQNKLTQRCEKVGHKKISVFAHEASLNGILDLGESGRISKNIIDSANFYYLIGCDSRKAYQDMQEILKKQTKDSFVVYQGHHGDRGATLANLILPGLTYTEKQATYVNVQGRVQRTQKAIFGGPEGAREDWKIIRALITLFQAESEDAQNIEVLQSPLHQASLNESQNFSHVDLLAPHLIMNSFQELAFPEEIQLHKAYTYNKKTWLPKISIALSTLQPREETSNVIRRNSLVMRRASKKFQEFVKERSWGG